MANDEGETPVTAGAWQEIDSIPLMGGHPRAELPRFGSAPADSETYPGSWVERHLEESGPQFARVDDALRSNGSRFGCGYAEIIITADERAVHVCIDSGIRIPKERVDEVNKLVMLCNRLLRLAGFAPVTKPDEAVKFTFDLARSTLETSDRTLRENAIAAEMLSRLVADSDNDQASAEVVRHLTRETKLERAIGMAVVSVKSYTGAFIAVAREGVSALDAFTS